MLGGGTKAHASAQAKSSDWRTENLRPTLNWEPWWGSVLCSSLPSARQGSGLKKLLQGKLHIDVGLKLSSAPAMVRPGKALDFSRPQFLCRRALIMNAISFIALWLVRASADSGACLVMHLPRSLPFHQGCWNYCCKVVHSVFLLSQNLGQPFFVYSW